MIKDNRGEIRAFDWKGEYSYFLNCFVRRISFEISCYVGVISKEIRRAEHEYLNIHLLPPLTL